MNNNQKTGKGGLDNDATSNSLMKVGCKNTCTNINDYSYRNNNAPNQRDSDTTIKSSMKVGCTNTCTNLGDSCYRINDAPNQRDNDTTSKFSMKVGCTNTCTNIDDSGYHNNDAPNQHVKDTVGCTNTCTNIDDSGYRNNDVPNQREDNTVGYDTSNENDSVETFVKVGTTTKNTYTIPSNVLGNVYDIDDSSFSINDNESNDESNASSYLDGILINVDDVSNVEQINTEKQSHSSKDNGIMNNKDNSNLNDYTSKTNNNCNSNNDDMSSMLPSNIPVVLEKINLPHSISKDVVVSVVWDDILTFFKDTNNHNKIASDVFRPNRLWKNKKAILKATNEYASLTGFTISSRDPNCLSCNRVGKFSSRGTSGIPRNTLSGQLKVNCTWRLRITSMHKKVTLINTKRNGIKKKNENDYDDQHAVSFTKNCCFNHKNPCAPSPTQQSFTNRVSGKYMTNISDFATFTLIELLDSNPNISSSTIRTILKSNVPKKHMITNCDIYNTKIRCFRLMKLYNDTNKDFEKFTYEFKRSKLYKGLDYQTLPDDEAINLSKIVWKDILEKSSSSQLEDNVWSLHRFMESMQERCNGFSYRIAYDNDNKANGIVWMTGTMRENFHRFGSFISLDAMKRATNTFLWHYFSTVLINDVGMNCLASEGIIVSEREDAYQFLMDSTIDMANEVRTKEEVYCVTGDGFFNKKTLEKWGFTNAHYISDHWHLFEHSLPKKFGRNYYDMISTELRNMAYSNNEIEFNHYFDKAKKT